MAEIGAILTMGDNRYITPISVRYLKRAIQAGPDECWGWTGSTDQSGYGMLAITPLPKSGRKMIRAHRVAWEVFRGPIPEGACVLHRCDNPICTNPAHLFLGTRQDNNRDRDHKRRGANRWGSMKYRTPAEIRREKRIAYHRSKGRSVQSTQKDGLTDRGDSSSLWTELQGGALKRLIGTCSDGSTDG